MSEVLRLPSIWAYPEQVRAPNSALERLATSVASRVRASATARRGRALLPVVARVQAAAEPLSLLDDGALRRSAQEAGAALRRAGMTDAASLAAVLGHVAEASSRVLGQRPYPPQLQAAACCARGMLAEMATGEGKTLAASLAAATVALSGTPVHLVTVNRYLGERDHAFAAPLYAFLGLSSGVVTEATSREGRLAAYRSDIAVAVNKDLAFDYMRDRLAGGRRTGNLRRKVAALTGRQAQPLLRGLHHAIVDEADSVLIDEARTPLVLSAYGGDGQIEAVYDRALELADALVPGEDFALLAGERRVLLLPPGRLRLEAAATSLQPWDVAEEREALVAQALTARHMLVRDEHYLLREGTAQIIDEFSGRVLADRTWNDGLQELVERKEGLALSRPRVTQARMTYQRFFRRYGRLSGLSGTLHEVAGELWRVYGVRVAKTRPIGPTARRSAPCRAMPTRTRSGVPCSRRSGSGTRERCRC